MKELVPYFKLLKPVRVQFALAIFCAMTYGLSSGFGLPFMTHKVFPLIFSNDGTKIELFTELETGDFFAVEGKPEAVTQDFFVKKEDQFLALQTPVQLTPTGFSLHQEGGGTQPIAQDLFVEQESEYVKVKGGLFTHDTSTQSYLSLKKEQKESSKWTLIGAVLMLPLVFMMRGASGFFNTYLISYCGLHILESIRLMVFHKMQHLPISFFQKHKSGDLLNRLLGDTAALQGAISLVANDVIKQPLTLIGGISYLIYQSWKQQESAFILLCFVVIGLCVFPIRYVGKHLLKKVFDMQSQQGDLSAIASENISAYREIRSFNLQDREESRFKASSQKFFTLQLKVIRYSQGLNPMIEVVTATGLSVAIFYAASKGITLNDILPLIMALYMSYDPIKKMGGINNQYRSGLAALKRLNFVLHQADETPEADRPEPFPKDFENIHFEKLSFAYDEEIVLKNVDLSVPKGSVVAMVGPSGAGKSTFGALIPRFYDPQSGSISINGMDIKGFSKHDLRQSISIVSQDTVLFDDDVLGNLRLGRTDASDEDVREAARQAQAHHFIEALPKGYNTQIGERGTRLSGGQKQRLAIARAFLKNSPILILDEATSALDSESEAKIQSALEKLIQGKTVFIIAHRFSTIKFADRILVFDKGDIVGDGPHEDLVKDCPLYKDLYERQGLG